MLSKFAKLMTGAFAFILGACQWFVIPAAAYMGPAILSFKAKVKDADDKKEIEGIRAEMLYASGFAKTNYTEKDGSVSFKNVPQKFSLALKDIDGAVNGSYQSTNIEIKFEDPKAYHLELDILLKKAK